MNVHAIARWWWVRVPSVLRPYASWLADAWTDGSYLLARPAAAFGLPIAMLVVGLIEGTTHWGPFIIGAGSLSTDNPGIVFAQMLPLLVLTVILASLSANLALTLAVGFAIADLIAGPRLSSEAPWLLGVLQLRAPQLVCAALFITIAISPAVTAEALFKDFGLWRRWFGKAYERVVVIGGAACRAVVLYAWVLSIPIVVRVAWSWSGNTPPVDLAYFLQVINPWLPILIVLACGGRAAIALLVEHEEPVVESVPTKAESDSSTIWKMSALALLLTSYVSGFIASFWLGLLVFAIVAAVLIGRALFLPRVAAWSAWAGLAARLPAIARWIIFSILAYLVPAELLNLPGWSASSNSTPGEFWAELVILGVLFVIGLALFPGTSAQPGSKPKTGVRAKGAATAASAGAGILLVISTTARARAICLDPSCCFNGDNLLLTLALMALGLALLGMALPIAALGALALGLAEGGELGSLALGLEEEGDVIAATLESGGTGSLGDLGLPDLNPLGGDLNCTQCVEAVERWYGSEAGLPGYALNTAPSSSGLGSLGDVASQLGGNWSDSTTLGDISSWMSNAGDGARGVVYGWDGVSPYGHVFNVVNQGGNIIAIDAQPGVYGSLGTIGGSYSGPGGLIMFLPTFP
jgi:hypothetical protein